MFCVGSKGVTTLNPNTHEITNHWPYNEFVGIQANPKATNEFIITMKKGGCGLGGQWSILCVCVCVCNDMHNYSVCVCVCVLDMQLYRPYIGRKNTQMTFSTDHRPEVITETLVS